MMDAERSETVTTRWMSALLIPAALAVLAGLACEPADRPTWDTDPPVAFDTTDIIIETADGAVRMTAEIAATRDQRAYGLMERPSLPAEHGMLFTYPEPQDPQAGFWMYRTLIPLDIAFLDEAGLIQVIREMEPCESPNPRLCPIYSPGVPWSAALEVNRGFFGHHGIGVGDRVRVADGGGS
jgi:uncharacterized protein